MTTTFQTWTMSVTFDGTPVTCLSARPVHGVDQGKGVLTLVTTASTADTLPDGADVVVTTTLNGGTPVTQFTGIYRSPDKNCSVRGNLATITCEGVLYRMEYPLEKDVVFSGGAKAAAAAVQTAARHIGNDTIAWYADTTGDGTTVSVTKTPTVDSSFVWVVGRLHGTNDYPTSLDDKKIKQWSRVEVWQAGAKLGFANFPSSSEQYSSMLPYSSDSNWTDFELFISAAIVAADGDITFKFISGQKPGTTLYDEYEVKVVTWQTAGKNTVREIIRGMMKRSGLATSQYRVNELTDLDGFTMKLGGNGLADAGQVRVSATESPLGFVTRIAGLFGYRIFDCPDGVVRCVPIRGMPTGTSAKTFAEGDNILSVNRRVNIRDIYNAVRVEGWSGTNQNRVRVAYSSQTATVDIEPSAYIPDPPGVSLLRISDSLLTSNTVCVDVRRIAEINHAEAAVFIEWETWPHNVRPGQVVYVDAPSIGFAGKVFLMSNDLDLSTSGFVARMVGWAGAAEPFDGDADADDPNPDEDDTEPGDPRPTDEWKAYRPSGGLN